MMDELCEWLIKLEGKVKILDLQQNDVASKGASELFNCLNKNKSTIKVIDLNDNKINDECMESLGNYIKNNHCIETIYLGNFFSETNKITDKGIEKLSSYFEGNKTFKAFRFQNNEGITDKSIPLMLKMIETSNIIDIYIRGTLISKANAFVVPLVNNILKCGFNKIYLSNRCVTDDDVIGICEILKKYDCSKLKEITLSENKISSKGGMVLFETLRQIKSGMIKIDVNENEIDDECVKSIGEFIENSEAIEEIRIGFNRLSDEGVEELSEYLIRYGHLKSLNLSSNKGVTNKSVPYLLEIAKKTSIISLYFSGPLISISCQADIIKLLEVPIDQREIPIKSSAKSAAKIS